MRRYNAANKKFAILNTDRRIEFRHPLLEPTRQLHGRTIQQRMHILMKRDAVSFQPGIMNDNPIVLRSALEKRLYGWPQPERRVVAVRPGKKNRNLRTLTPSSPTPPER